MHPVKNQLKNQRFLVSAIVITLIIILSARSYMAMQEVRLNSDNAIHVLMTQDLVLPDDLYYWGQDRLGSIVPMLGHGLMRLFSLPPVVAVSGSQYFFLLLGFLAFASLIQNVGLRVVFALIWFLPLGELTELLAISQPYGPQMAFIGLAVALAQRLSAQAETLKPALRQGLISAIAISWFISIWVSDFSVVLALIFTGVVLFSRDRPATGKPQPKGLARFKLTRLDVLNIGVIATLSIAFIRFAKANASSHQAYGTFSSLPQILSVVSSLCTSAINTLTFRSNPTLPPLSQYNFAAAIHGILVAIVAIEVSRILWRGRRTSLPISRWTVFFFSSSIVSFALLLCIRWIYNGGAVDLRYFTVVYVCLWTAAILFVDGLVRADKGSGLKASTLQRLGLLLICAALASSWTLPTRVFELEQRPSTIEKLQPFVGLGRAGFIGDYWSSYVLCTVNPAQLACVSRDRRGKTPCPPTLVQRPIRLNGTRCIRCIPKVLAADTIYLVKEKWLESFPPEIEQYRRCLTRVGEPRKVGKYTIAPYAIKN
jgi:hypothetical protein